MKRSLGRQLVWPVVLSAPTAAGPTIAGPNSGLGQYFQGLNVG
jgi:hypothetical protein